MKHKFSGEICIYCNNTPAESTDHIVGRKFFLIERRDNLPLAPACKRCNGQKSALENYLMIVLGFGAKHRDAAVNLKTQVAHRLENRANAKILRSLEKGYERSGGTSVPFEHKPLEQLFAMIAKALAWVHFGVRLGPNFSSIASIFTNEGERFFERKFANGGNHVTGNLGQGTFMYEGTQAAQYSELTLWRFRIYGGVDFGGDPAVYGPSSLAIAVTGRLEMIHNLRYTSFQKDRKSPKVGRNDPCPCGSGKKHKKCHGLVIRAKALKSMPAVAAARQIIPSTYQPIAGHGYGPQQLEEMRRYVQGVSLAHSDSIDR